LAREVDQDGKRSIGVLTKPDSVEVGKENDIVEILAGENTKPARARNAFRSRPCRFCFHGEFTHQCNDTILS
jgi:hypothetical protein